MTKKEEEKVSWIIPILMILTILVIVLVFTLESINQNDCKEVMPEGYEFQGGIVFFETLECYYETEKEAEYDWCTKYLMKTNNHGKQIVKDTCPKEVKKNE